jgi:hypothetical protein
MDDSKLQSGQSGENKNSMKNIGNFLIAGVGLIVAMVIVAILVRFKKSPFITRIITSLE